MANDTNCTAFAWFLSLRERLGEGIKQTLQQLSGRSHHFVPSAYLSRRERNCFLLSAVTCFTAATAFGLCADDAVLVGGTLCVDKFEASVWSNPPGGNEPRTQYGVAGEDYPCNRNGQDCDHIYAASLAGQTPSGYASWFQAQQACANAGKRLLTNDEWQLAVTGTPDTGGADNGTTDCATDDVPLIDRTVATGSRSGCVSRWGAYDMVGNAGEWVADWAPNTSVCTGWGDFSDDLMCFAGANPQPTSPGALVRGAAYDNEAGAGPLTISVSGPILGGQFVGFRCVRPAS